VRTVETGERGEVAMVDTGPECNSEGLAWGFSNDVGYVTGRWHCAGNLVAASHDSFVNDLIS